MPLRRCFAHDRLELARAAKFIVKEVLPRQPRGFTVDPRRLETPSFGVLDYAVSLRGHEQRFRGVPDERILTSWLRPRAELLSLPWWYVGGWPDPESHEYCLDVSFRVRGLDAAASAGRLNRQKTIYWPHGDRVISLDKTVRAATLETPHGLTPALEPTVQREVSA